jgi:hypothetical protein
MKLIIGNNKQRRWFILDQRYWRRRNLTIKGQGTIEKKMEMVG